MASHASLVVCILLAVSASLVQGRQVLQAPPADPTQWIDPSGTPKKCTGGALAGNQWSGDEIECHVCPNNEYQLKCDLDTDIIGDDSAKCKFDRGGLAQVVNNGKSFDCVLAKRKTPPLQCDWAKLATIVPACALEPVRRILATWVPKE